MFKLIFKRILEAIPTMFFLITVSFFVMRLAPGSPFSSERNLPPAVLANIEAKYGLDDPIWLQYINYLKNLLHGDFGPSFKHKDHTINYLLEQTVPVSFEIGFYAFIIALVLGVSFGVISALKQNSIFDYLIMAVAMTGVVVPSFVKAPLFVLIFAITLKWLPAGGWNGGSLQHMILPISVLAIAYMSSIARVTRGSMIEVLNSPYIRTARAKGLPTSQIVLKHALRPAMLPVISFLGPAFVGIITGSIVIETIFGLPGIGRLLIEGATSRDYSLVLSLTILVGVLTIAFNAVVDILYTLIDPRITY